MPTSTVENYLKQLYLEERDAGGDMILMGRLAAAMGVAPGTATSMVKSLADEGLVDYRPRSGVRLTASGRKLALSVLRRHRLVELFLVKVLGLDWSVVHEEAEALEHVISERVLERIDAVLGHPTTDPHGDPIPTSKGQVQESSRVSMANCPTGERQRVVRVADQEPDFLQFLERQGLMPGAMVTVDMREPAADVIVFSADRRAQASLGLAAASKILVETTAEHKPRRRGAPV